MNVQEFLGDRDVSFELLEHDDTYQAQRLAQVLHVSGKEVAKTVLLKADGGYMYIVAVLPASKEIDFDLASQGFGGSRLELATEAEIAERCPDCEIGVLPPFGSEYGMKTIVDTSLTEDEEIVFEGNNHHEAIRMNFADYVHIEEPLIIRFTGD